MVGKLNDTKFGNTLQRNNKKYTGNAMHHVASFKIIANFLMLSSLSAAKTSSNFPFGTYTETCSKVKL